MVSPLTNLLKYSATSLRCLLLAYSLTTACHAAMDESLAACPKQKGLAIAAKDEKQVNIITVYVKFLGYIEGKLAVPVDANATIKGFKNAITTQISEFKKRFPHQEEGEGPSEEDAVEKQLQEEGNPAESELEDPCYAAEVEQQLQEEGKFSHAKLAAVMPYPDLVAENYKLIVHGRSIEFHTYGKETLKNFDIQDNDTVHMVCARAS